MSWSRGHSVRGRAAGLHDCAARDRLRIRSIPAGCAVLRPLGASSDEAEPLDLSSSPSLYFEWVYDSFDDLVRSLAWAKPRETPVAGYCVALHSYEVAAVIIADASVQVFDGFAGSRRRAFARLNAKSAGRLLFGRMPIFTLRFGSTYGVPGTDRCAERRTITPLSSKAVESTSDAMGNRRS